MLFALRRSRCAFEALSLSLCLLAGCSASEAPDDALPRLEGPEVARIVPAAQALTGAHIPTVDLASMDEAEIRKALQPGSRCDFRYTTRGKPVLSMSRRPDGMTAGGVVKLNGYLVMLEAASSSEADGSTGDLRLLADPIRIDVLPDARGSRFEARALRRAEANAILHVGQRLQVGYRGYLDCTDEPQTISPGETSGR